MRTRRRARFLTVLICAAAWTLQPAPAQAIDLSSWYYRDIGAGRAWEYGLGEGVTVAVVDSGVDESHPVLDGSVLDGISYVIEDDSESDEEANDDGHLDPVGHGTAVAALIAGGQDSPTPGIAPEADILPVRVLDDENRYHDATVVARAIEWAVDQGADVVNLSLGGEQSAYALADALAYAARNDVLVVACTGNGDEEDDPAVWYPGRDPLTMAVTGVGPSGERWPSAITGDETTIAAPSVNLRAPSPGGGYRNVTGTSFSTALVSGAAALLRAENPGASADEVRQMLLDTARPAGADTGAGVLDVAAAIGVDPDTVVVEQPVRQARLGVAEAGAAAVVLVLLTAVAAWIRPRRRESGAAGEPAPARSTAGV